MVIKLKNGKKSPFLLKSHEYEYVIVSKYVSRIKSIETQVVTLQGNMMIYVSRSEFISVSGTGSMVV